MTNHPLKLIVLFSVLSLAGVSQGLYAADETMDSILTQFKSADPDVRSAAYAHAVARPDVEKKDPYEKALIGLLTLETVYSTSTPVEELQDDDEWNAYYKNLIATVSKLRNADSIPALLNVLDKGDVVTQSLAGFGTDVLDAVLPKINSANQGVRLAAVTVLFEMLNPENETKIIDPRARNKMEVALKSVLHDPNPNIQTTAAEALKKLKTLKKRPESTYNP